MSAKFYINGLEVSQNDYEWELGHCAVTDFLVEHDDEYEDKDALMDAANKEADDIVDFMTTVSGLERTYCNSDFLMIDNEDDEDDEEDE